MSNLTILAIDLAKNTLQVCKIKPNQKVVFNKAISRSALQKLLAKEEKCLVAMEACSSSQYWCRLATQHGHQVKAMHARHVKAFRTNQKTDKNDARAIAVAAIQETVKATRILTVEEQALQSMERVRDLVKTQTIAMSNQLRGLLGEFGIVINKGEAALRTAIPLILEDAENGLPFTFREVLYHHWEAYRTEVEHLDKVTHCLEKEIKKNQQCINFMALEGVGPLSALALVIALGDGKGFRNGREASACLGVTPTQHSSGGKENIGSISKHGSDKKLRSTLYNGAITVVSLVEKRPAKTHKEAWLKELILRRGKKVAAIALINKNIRTAFALVREGCEYKPQLLTA